MSPVKLLVEGSHSSRKILRLPFWVDGLNLVTVEARKGICRKESNANCFKWRLSISHLPYSFFTVVCTANFFAQVIFRRKFFLQRPHMSDTFTVASAAIALLGEETKARQGILSYHNVLDELKRAGTRSPKIPFIATVVVGPRSKPRCKAHSNHRHSFDDLAGDDTNT